MAERVKFYVDEHVQRAATQGLRRRGVDVLTTQEASMLERVMKSILPWRARRNV